MFQKSKKRYLEQNIFFRKQIPPNVGILSANTFMKFSKLKKKLNKSTLSAQDPWSWSTLQ